MKVVLFAASLLAALPLALSAANAGARGHQSAGDAGEGYTQATLVGPVVTVSCWRGPWKEVIWDRPNPVFMDSLVDAGYTLETAMEIAERVCRDPAGVGNSDQLTAIAYKVLDQTRAQRRH